MNKINNTTRPTVKFNMEELGGDVFDFSVEFTAEDVVDYDIFEKCNEFKNMEIVLEKDEGCAEVLNAADLDEEFDEEDVYIYSYIKLHIH